jgi:hypothetical protein
MARLAQIMTISLHLGGRFAGDLIDAANFDWHRKIQVPYWTKLFVHHQIFW